MRVLIVFLTVLAFLQQVTPVNLVLVVILLRSYIRPSKENLYLAFFFGILVAYLKHINLGIYPLMLLVLIEGVLIFRKIPLSNHPIVSGAIILINLFLNSLLSLVFFTGESLMWQEIVYEGILAIPLYFLLKFWEERFVVKHEIKLKI